MSGDMRFRPLLKEGDELEVVGKHIVAHSASRTGTSTWFTKVGYSF